MRGELLQQEPEISRCRSHIVSKHEAGSAFHQILVGRFGKSHQSLDLAEIGIGLETEKVVDQPVKVGTDGLCTIEVVPVDTGVEDCLKVGREVLGISVAIGTGDSVLFDEAFLIEGFQQTLGGPNPESFTNIGVRNGIGLPFELDVVVRVNSGLFPLGNFEALCWQR